MSQIEKGPSLKKRKNVHLEVPSAEIQKLRKQQMILEMVKPPKMSLTTLKQNSLKDSSILARAKSFLPQIKSANEKLQETEPKEFNLEDVDTESDKPYIEMDLALVSDNESSDSSSEDECEVSDEGATNKTKTNSKPLIEEIDKQKEC